MDAFLAECAELGDADRRAFLYADMPTHNPEGARQMETSWAHLLTTAVSRGLLGPQRLLLLTPSTLASRFTFLGDTPSGLPQVLQQLCHSGRLQPLDSYCQPANVFQMGRGLLRRAAELVGLGWPQLPCEAPLVVVGLAERAAGRVLECWRARAAGGLLTDCLMSVAEFRSRFAGCLGVSVVAPEDALVLVRLLAAQGHLCVEPSDTCPADPDACLLKFAPPTALLAQPSNRRQGQRITNVDLAAYRLMRMQSELQAQVDALDRRAAELLSQTRGVLQSSRGSEETRRQRARDILRLCRHVERTELPRRHGQLVLVEDALDRLCRAQSDAAMLQAVELATGALAEINREVSAERVGRMVELWEEAREDAGHVAVALGDMAGLGGDAREEEDEELERELEELAGKQAGKDALAGEQANEEELAGEPFNEEELAHALRRVRVSSKPDTAPPDAGHSQEGEEKEEEHDHPTRSPERIPVPAE